MLTNILVATDASPASNRAINLAADLAGKYDATLHLIYAVREMQLPPELKKMAEVEKIAGARSDVLDFVGKKILGDAEVRAQKKGATKIKTSLEHGDPATAIMRYAKSARSTSSCSAPAASIRSRACSWAVCLGR